LDPKAKQTGTVKEIADDLGSGKKLTLNNLRSDGMEFFTTFTVRDGKGFLALNAQIAALDPVGRLVDPGTTYEPADLFYVDVTSADPFVALESYGMALRTATKSHPNTYNNFTICGWFSHRNSAKALVDELDYARKSSPPTAISCKGMSTSPM